MLNEIIIIIDHQMQTICAEVLQFYNFFLKQKLACLWSKHTKIASPTSLQIHFCLFWETVVEIISLVINSIW